MASELEKALERAKYVALPLPRKSSGPTTIFSFSDGYLYIVRDPHTCLPDPPLSVRDDPSVDTVEFTRTFTFDIKGILGFFTRLLGIGVAKAQLEAQSVSRATVQMGQLSHHTVQTGQMIEYLLKQQPSHCLRDILLTID